MAGTGARSGSASATPPECERREPGSQQHECEQRRNPVKIRECFIPARKPFIQHDTGDAVRAAQARVAESNLVGDFLQMWFPQRGQVLGAPHFRVLNDVARLHDLV